MKDIRNVDFVTTVFNIMGIVVCLLTSIMTFFAAAGVMKTAGEMVENMPDGTGVADGYIVLGKLFGGGLVSITGLVLLVICIVMVFFLLLYSILGVIYHFNRRKYENTGLLVHLQKNVRIKSVVNGLQIAGLLWFLVDGRVFDLLSISIVVILCVIEVVLVKSLGGYDEAEGF